MVYLDARGKFKEYFREILSNPFVDDRTNSDLRLAIIGARNTGDAKAVPLLIEKVSNLRLDNAIAEDAVRAAIQIDTPHIIPESIRNWQAKEEFTGLHLKTHYQDSLRGLDSGGPSHGYIAALGAEEEFRSRVFRPMIEYLKRHGRPNTIDYSRASKFISVLARAELEEAREVLIDIARHPAKFSYIDLNDMEPQAAQNKSKEAQTLKEAALKGLGGSISLLNADDPAAKVLHTVSRKESFKTYRDAAFTSLETMADRYETALANLESDAARAQELRAARLTHGFQVLETLRYLRQGLDESLQLRLKALTMEFTHAKLADKLGATKELLVLADQEAKKAGGVFSINDPRERNKDLRPSIVRSVMHALRANGKTDDDIAACGFEPEIEARLKRLFAFVNREVHWLGEPNERPYTGKGVEVAVIDGGYVLPVDVMSEMADNIVYPESMPGWSWSSVVTSSTSSTAEHPTGVAGVSFLKNPDARIHTYSQQEGQIRHIPFRPLELQRSTVRAFEHIIEQKITGKADIDAINCSFLEVFNTQLIDPKKRHDMRDLLSAYMELASTLGIKHSVAACNNHSVDPAGEEGRFVTLGEVSNLGMRFNRDGSYTQPDGIFIAGALDAYAGNRLAEYTSKGDPLQPENNMRIISFHGTHISMPWINGTWVLMPRSGTSFAAPNQLAMMEWAEEAFETAGISLTMKEWRELFERSRMKIDDGEAYEGGYYFHTPTFLREINRIIEERNQAQTFE